MIEHNNRIAVIIIKFMMIHRLGRYTMMSVYSHNNYCDVIMSIIIIFSSLELTTSRAIAIMAAIS